MSMHRICSLKKHDWKHQMGPDVGRNSSTGHTADARAGQWREVCALCAPRALAPPLPAPPGLPALLSEALSALRVMEPQTRLFPPPDQHPSHPTGPPSPGLGPLPTLRVQGGPPPASSTASTVFLELLSIQD